MIAAYINGTIKTINYYYYYYYYCCCCCCPTLLNMASTGNRTPGLLILSPTSYPLGHMLHMCNWCNPQILISSWCLCEFYYPFTFFVSRNAVNNQYVSSYVVLMFQYTCSMLVMYTILSKSTLGNFV